MFFFFTIAYPKTRVGQIQCTQVIALHENFHTFSEPHESRDQLLFNLRVFREKTDCHCFILKESAERHI